MKRRIKPGDNTDHKTRRNGRSASRTRLMLDHVTTWINGGQDAALARAVRKAKAANGAKHRMGLAGEEIAPATAAPKFVPMENPKPIAAEPENPGIIKVDPSNKTIYTTTVLESAETAAIRKFIKSLQDIANREAKLRQLFLVESVDKNRPQVRNIKDSLAKLAVQKAELIRAEQERWDTVDAYLVESQERVLGGSRRESMRRILSSRGKGESTTRSVIHFVSDWENAQAHRRRAAAGVKARSRAA